jgi:renin receptor
LAELTSKNYPVVFNIIFWFSLIFIFALLAISLALSNVEDKDSIIYRMTGARGKKDN